MSKPTSQIDPVAPESIETCIHVLESILADRTTLAQVPEEQRRRLVMAAGRLSRPDRIEIMKLAKQHRRRHKRDKMALDRAATAQTKIREARRAEVFIAPEAVALPAPNPERPRLHLPRNCYVCKAEYVELHFFYDAMCVACGDLNYRKRFQTVPLHGRTALITGARVKIGYQAALMMLRAGAKVIVTTRFPHDAALRFAREADYAEWSGRLEIHGLDLRHAPSVEHFTEYVAQTQDRLDVLINNAAQTVRRPPGFYRHLIDLENLKLPELPEAVRPVLRAHETWKNPAALIEFERTHRELAKDEWVTELAMEGAAIGLRVPALLSQLSPDARETVYNPQLFPEGKLDADRQQVDLRTMNSWRMRLADVPTPELIEVQLVNSIAPFILCSKLKPLMLRVPTLDKHIINVSAMEGKFNRFTKTDKHPHTNMAKAALNMMTLTSAPDYARDGIFMNAVDTGWVTDEDPAQHATRKKEELDFQPPLDIVDGAARVCDPFFYGLLTGEHVWGKFLKDYAPTAW